MVRRLSLLLLTMVTALSVHGQCPIKNTAFQGGETLEYKLFFNWKFVWLDAGTATMTIANATSSGKSCYKAHLITRTSKRLDKFFCMRDTLQSLVTKELIPLYYRKGANEGGKYRLNEVRYSYPGGKTHLRMRYINPKGEIRDTIEDHGECAFDMLSMMLRARSFNSSDFKIGQKICFPMADGKHVAKETLIYRGIKTFTTEETKITYRCLVFSFVEFEGKKQKEVVTFYVTDDANHMPVRLDLFLKFGVAKAYLTRSSGLRNSSTSIVSKK